MNILPIRVPADVAAWTIPACDFGDLNKNQQDKKRNCKTCQIACKNKSQSACKYPHPSKEIVNRKLEDISLKFDTIVTLTHDRQAHGIGWRIQNVNGIQAQGNLS